MFQPTLMTGQRILITGGGTGLGKSMAERFLALGADAISSRRPKRSRHGLSTPLPTSCSTAAST
jgi:NAD(P)-dependent dehydrogenase (short-subunit alcohol dehydrogenase family)